MSVVRRWAAAGTVVLAIGALTACQDVDAPNEQNTPALAGPPSSTLPEAATTAGRQVRPLRPMSRHEVLRALEEGPAHARWAHLDLVVRSRQQTLTGRGDMSYSRRSPAVRMELAGSSGANEYVEVVAVAGSYYLSVPGKTPQGKFLRIVPTASDSPLGRDFGRISGELDPLSALVSMRSAFGRVHVLGRDRLYGRPAMRYALHVRLREGMAARGITTGLEQVPRSVTYRLWFDRHRLVRRIAVRFAGLRVRSEMSRWGKQVHITPPAADQLVARDGG